MARRIRGEEYLTLAEVKEELGVSKWKVEGERRAGNVRSAGRGKQRVFLRADVETITLAQGYGVTTKAMQAAIR